MPAPTTPASFLRSIARLRFWLILGPVYLYRALTFWVPPTCRYEPSCSRYMMDAVMCHGLIKGTYAGIRRIIRCNPYGGSGYDPAQAFKWRWEKSRELSDQNRHV